MTGKQKIFEGLSYDWKWASWSRDGSAIVHVIKPEITDGDVFGAWNSCNRVDWDLPIPPEGIEPEVIERVLPEIMVPMASTDGHGNPLHLQKPVPPPAPVPPAPVWPSNIQLFTQDVFKEDLSNGQLCKFAALNQEGVVWLFEAMPTLFGTDFMSYGYSQRLDGKFKDMRAGSGQPVVIEKGLTGAINFARQEALQVAPAAPSWAPLPDYSQVKPPVGKPCTFAEQGCIRVDCDGDHGFATEEARDKFYGAGAYHVAPAVAGNVYPINHPGPIHQYAEEVFVWYDEAGLQGGVAYSLEQANADKARYFEYLDKPSDTLELNNIRSRITKMFNVNELTTTQVLAILGDHWQ